MAKTRVLFLCTGNTARSQMAEGLLRKYAGDQFEVHSAGLEPGVIHPLTIQVLEEAGIDASEHYSKGLTFYLSRMRFGYLITVCDQADKNCPVFPGMGVRLHWHFEDPAAGEGSDAEKLARFRQVRDQIDAQVCAWLAEQGVPSQVAIQEA
ncbi:MAG: arsenate reductase ArsC [Anaerolineaceae bacterium]|nr:arsenate reductase ArsC [Anaerolineaceae bacterium]